MVFIFFLFACGIAACTGSRVLVVFPVPGKSHGILGESVVKTLLGAGHEVTYVSPLPPEIWNSNLKYVDISSVAFLSGQKPPTIAELHAAPHRVTHVHQVGPVFARNTLQHPAVQALLRDPDLTFDLVIAEWFFSALLAPIAEVFDCPLIWYRSGEMCWQALQLMHEASSPAYSRDLHVDGPTTMPLTLSERLYQAALQLYVTCWTYFNNRKAETTAYEEIYGESLRIRGKPLVELDSLLYNGSLMFSNSHPLLGQKLALPLNVRHVGGHHIELMPPPLPKDLKKIMDESENGVIFFSMGSMLKGKHLPDHLKTALVAMFGQLDQTVIWKLEEEVEDLPKNIHTVNWAPQQSVLNHPNTVLFISHGGILSILEATHFAVPIIGVPIFGDQFNNVNQATARGVAVRADFSGDFATTLSVAINEILGNNSYRTNAKAASLIFRDRLSLPQSELKYWVQLVISTRGAQHLRSPALQVSAPERFYLDVLVLLIMLLWFLAKVVKVIKVHLNSSDLDKKNA